VYIGLVVATVRANFGGILFDAHSLAVSMAVARSNVQQRRQLPKRNYAA